MSIQAWFVGVDRCFSRKLVLVKMISSIKHYCFLLPLIIFAVFVTSTAKAAEYHWEYGGGQWHYFASYDEGCSYHLDWLQKKVQKNVFPTSISLLEGYPSAYRPSGVPSSWVCRFQTDIYFPNGSITTSSSIQGFVRIGNECIAPKYLSIAGSCVSPTDDTKNPPGGSCSTTSSNSNLSQNGQGSIIGGSSVGNPINFMTGNKVLDETDIPAIGDSPLHFSRHYNSLKNYQYQTGFGSVGRPRDPMGLQ